MRKLLAVTLLSLSPFAALSQGFEDDFATLDSWTLFGSPLPLRLNTMYGRTGVFDNNGDPTDNSGAISKQVFNLSSGFTLEADVYLDFTNLAGCWAEAAAGIANPAYQSSGVYDFYLAFNIAASGDACWGTPAPLRRHASFNGYYATASGWETFFPTEADPVTLRADQYVNGWHTLKIEVDKDRMPRFYVDNTLIYEGKAPIQESVMSANRPIWLGSRSSGSAGKAYHDRVSLVCGPKRVPVTYEFFDDFRYTSARDPGFTENWNCSPANTSISFEGNAQYPGDRLAVLVNPMVPGDESEASIETSDYQFKDGTYAARVRWTDPSENSKTPSIHAFYTYKGGGSCKPNHSECDFEYYSLGDDGSGPPRLDFRDSAVPS